MIHRFRRAALASSIAVLTTTSLVACSDGDGGTDAPIDAPTTDAGTPPTGTGAPPPGIGAPPPGTGTPPNDTDTPPVGTGTPPDGSGEPTAGPDMPPVAATLTEDDLRGSWSTGCLLDDPEDPDSEYESASISFDDEEFEFESDSFTDAGCTDSLGEDVELEGTFSLGGGVVTTDGLEATAIDLVTSEDGGDVGIGPGLARDGQLDDVDDRRRQAPVRCPPANAPCRVVARAVDEHEKPGGTTRQLRREGAGRQARHDPLALVACRHAYHELVARDAVTAEEGQETAATVGPLGIVGRHGCG